MEQWYATGKRKTAVARVFLRPGKGEIVVNGKNTKDYFYTDSNIMKIDAPLAITKTQGKFDILVTVCGGGICAQAEAVRHGISKALVEYDPEMRSALKKEGFLRRDARMKERKKYGLRSARARYQFSKR
ncbi:30S ribosomal protein S9 [bacterium]|jgi:Ribosomal protein S9|nr:30S ribosomal protein S9 [bacterium]MBQ3367766.1 30S ribosomal protein S9 [bacterium]MBQ4438338.1 30S ribosomal protein S9 [bacterium]MBR6422548.1 30S ribosomal protein S9 [bacterium]